MIFGITGAFGFLGWHARAFLHSLGVDNVRVAGRETFSSPGLLEKFVHGCDVIFHFAGVNRSDSESEIANENPALARQLVAALVATKSTPFIVYSSSTHETGDSVYGGAKRAAGEILEQWADAAGAGVAVMVYPHLYGECGKPFYNSALHTFCHQIVNGEEPSVKGNGELQLLHAQDAVELAWRIACDGNAGRHFPEGRRIRVREVAERLRHMYSTYASGVIPDLRDADDLRLFNTLRSFMFPASYPMKAIRHEDPRGWLFEAVRELNGGQVFLSSTRPGFTRGNHYHRFKVERFCVLSGSAVIRVRRLFSEEVHEFRCTGEEPCYIDMPPLHTHSIANESSSEVLTLFWSHEFFDPQSPDTYSEPVLLERG